jgi:hydroxymethylglutaryl-CoA synthase
MKTHVGIEALHLAVPRRYLDLSELACARGVEPAKFLVGLGVKEMAVAEPGEDTVALAAAAGRRLLEASGVMRSEIGMLVVGTETGVDHSKPVASFVQGLLDLPEAMRTFDTQHACYGGTAGLMAASGWVASGAAAGKKALVICSDIARYGVGTAGEPTQGAGAVAMLVSSNPELLELDYGLSGAFAAHVHDFWRPLGHRDAQVDGHYSQECYLRALSGAYGAWREAARARAVVRASEALPSEQLARVAYHVPFCKMAKKAHAQVRRLDREERSSGPSDAADEASFQTQVQPSLSLCSRVGNIYTGALYLALAGMLEDGGEALAGKRLGLFSYGSGCSSEFFSGVVGPRAGERVRALGLSRLLDERERIDVPEYERILSLPAAEPLDSSPASLAFRFAGVAAHRRQYLGAT